MFVSWLPVRSGSDGTSERNGLFDDGAVSDVIDEGHDEFRPDLEALGLGQPIVQADELFVDVVDTPEIRRRDQSRHALPPLARWSAASTPAASAAFQRAAMYWSGRTRAAAPSVKPRRSAASPTTSTTRTPAGALPCQPRARSTKSSPMASSNQPPPCGASRAGAPGATPFSQGSASGVERRVAG